jgi:hypothetical protein
MSDLGGMQDLIWTLLAALASLRDTCFLLYVPGIYASLQSLATFSYPFGIRRQLLQSQNPLVPRNFDSTNDSGTHLAYLSVADSIGFCWWLFDIAFSAPGLLFQTAHKIRQGQES